MDKKLQNLERAQGFLRIHRYACFVAAGIIIALCVRGAVRHHGSVEQNISFGLLGIGCCVFSLLTGVKQKRAIDYKLEQYKSQQTEV